MTMTLSLLGGCFEPGPMTREELERGMIVLLPGVECTMNPMKGIVLGLRDAGVDRAIDVVQWGHVPFGTFRNLHNLPRNRRRAARIAERIVAYQQGYPQRPVTLIGYSGGGGIAVLAAETLPEGVTVERIILLGSALSPGYDLTAALGRSNRSVVHFYSPRDWYQLGVGTRLLGTIDRKYVESAGRRGFADGDGELLEHEKLEQIAWRPEWRNLGHRGDHWGWLSRRWVRQMLAEHVDPSFGPRHNDE